MMVDKLRKQIIFCSEKNCEVEVTYSIPDDQLSLTHEVIACSEFHDGEVNCEIICMAMFGFADAIRSGTDHKTR
jgi:hypothetical protein